MADEITWYDVATRCPECGETALRARYGMIVQEFEDLGTVNVAGEPAVAIGVSAHEGWLLECTTEDCRFEPQEGVLRSDRN